MERPTLEQIRHALSSIPYPGFSRDIVSFGMLGDVVFNDDGIRVTLLATTKDEKVFDELRRRVIEVLEPLPGAGCIRVEFQHKGPMRLPSAGEAGPQQTSIPPLASRIIGIASGKGGVGKSTVAVNLAVCLAKTGRKVGFLDADVHGPSAPLLFGLEGKHPQADQKTGRPLPLEAHGVRVMSMGFFVDRDNAVIWRGPIVGNFIRQLLTDVDWGDLDDLIIDFPPGTGDAQLTISQTLTMTGCLVVTTPNDLALIDALKAIAMFRKVEVPIWGVVENMAFFVCPHCDQSTDIFGRGLVDKAAREQGVPVLGRIPLDPEVVSESDRGVPVVISRPDCAAAQAYRDIALRLESSAAADKPKPGGLGRFLEKFGYSKG